MKDKLKIILLAKNNSTKLVLLCLLFFLSLPQQSNAQYRVYQYLVKEDNLKAVSLLSNLSPSSYIAYYGTSENFKIDLLRTWMCPGDTSNFKQYCKSPYNNSLKIKQLIGNL